MLFCSYHVDGRNGRGYALQDAARVGISGVGCRRQSTRAGVLGVPDAGVGMLVGGCFDVVLPVKRVSDSKGTGDEDPGCCFSPAILMERRCASQSPAGLGHISGIRSQGQPTRCRVLDDPDAGVGTLVGVCHIVFLSVVSLPSALSRRSL